MDSGKIDPSKKLHQTGVSPSDQEGPFAQGEGAEPKAKIDSQGSGSTQKDLSNFSIELESPNNENQAQRANSFYENWSDEDYEALVCAFGEDDVANKDPNELFFESVKQGKAKAFEAFLRDEKIDINQKDQRGFSPLQWASSLKRKDFKELLISHPQQNLKKENSFYKDWSNKDLLILVDTFGADRVAREDPNKLFMKSANQGKTEALKAFLGDERIDVNQVDAKGFTPLAHAARFGQTECLKELLKRGDIDVNQKAMKVPHRYRSLQQGATLNASRNSLNTRIFTMI